MVGGGSLLGLFLSSASASTTLLDTHLRAVVLLVELFEGVRVHLDDGVLHECLRAHLQPGASSLIKEAWMGVSVIGTSVQHKVRYPLK